MTSMYRGLRVVLAGAVLLGFVGCQTSNEPKMGEAKDSPNAKATTSEEAAKSTTLAPPLK